MKEYTSCFLGIPLPDKYLHEFKRVLAEVKDVDTSFEVVDPQTPHITVYYLDKQSQAALPEITEVVEQNKPIVQGVSLRIGKLGFFRPGNPRVLFLKVGYPISLVNFNEVMASSLSNFYAENNNLPFSPHLTIARMRIEEAQASFAKKKQLLEEKLSQISWKFPVKELALYGVDSRRQPEHQEKLVSIKV